MKSASSIAFCMVAANAYSQGGGYYPVTSYAAPSSAVAPTSAYNTYDPRYPTNSRFGGSSRPGPSKRGIRAKPTPRYRGSLSHGSRVEPIERADYFANTNQYNNEPKSVERQNQKLLYPTTHQVSTPTTHRHQPTSYLKTPTVPSYQKPVVHSIIPASIHPSTSHTSLYPSQTAHTHSSFQSQYPQHLGHHSYYQSSVGYQADRSQTTNLYGVCEFKKIGVTGIGGIIRFAQHPGYSVKVKGALTGGSAIPNEDVVEFKITTLGDITGDCANMGEEFIPTFGSTLFTPWGQVVPSADTIGSKIMPVAFMTSAQEFSQDKLLQNLAGKDSIIGLGLQLTDQSDGAILGCCTIGKDVFSASSAAHVNVTDD